MKRCPTCNKIFNEDHLSFCLDDGTPLVATHDDEATVVQSPPNDGEETVVRPTPNDGSTATGFSSSSTQREATPYQPPSYVPPGSYGQNKSRTWPWVLGIFAILVIVFAGLGIAAVALIPRLMRASNNNTNVNANVERHANSNANVNSAVSNYNLNSNSNSADRNANSNEAETTPPPTDRVAVLSDLTNLEHDWTVANINADKRKLNEILADDYVGITDGRKQGKAEYLKTIERDTVIQKWSFEDLKVDLNSDRATLTGTLRVDLKDEQGQVRPGAFHFTDKFVWREGRWQATGSEVKVLDE